MTYSYPLIISLTSSSILFCLITQRQPRSCSYSTPGPLHCLSLCLDHSCLSYPQGSIFFIKLILMLPFLKKKNSLKISNLPQHPQSSCSIFCLLVLTLLTFSAMCLFIVLLFITLLPNEKLSSLRRGIFLTCILRYAFLEPRMYLAHT